MLTSCRRVIFLFLLLLLSGGIALWAYAPDVNNMRPEIETFLKQELGLKALKLGNLSWYWAGHLGVKATASSFSSHDDSIVVHQSNITVNISMLDFFSGTLTPAGIHLSGGNISIVQGHRSEQPQIPVPDLITLKDMRLNWEYEEMSGEIEHFTMSFDRDDHVMQVQFPGVHVEAQLRNGQFPNAIEATFSDLNWLPDQWKPQFDGGLSGKIETKEQNVGKWKIDFSVASTQSKPVNYSNAGETWQFDSMKGEFAILEDAHSHSVLQVEGKLFEWKLGKNIVRATGLWRDGRLQLSASSSYLGMPLIWQNLKPLGGDSWHEWLASMQSGVASEARADVELMWAIPWQASPSSSELDAMHYHVTAHVEDADIALGMPESLLTHTVADVELDQEGLKAKVVSTQLPHAVGSVSGGLHISWDTLLLNVSGSGNADAGKLHTWLDKSDAEKLGWKIAPAYTDFRLQWIPAEDRPRKAEINLKPLAPWMLTVKKIPVRVTTGEVKWRLSEGIQFSELVWSTPHLNVTTDMSASVNDQGQWRVLSMQSTAEGELDELAAYFLLPIEAADGRVTMELDFDGVWHGGIGLEEASWENFLGIKKMAGKPLRIDYSGVNGMKQGKAALLIKELHCNDALLRLRGVGAVSEASLWLDLQHIETALFTGAIDIRAPFGPEPWELAVDAEYLNRKALPVSLSRSSGELAAREKPWAFRANLARFVWDDAEIKGASIKLASALNSIAILKAASLRSGDLIVKDLLTIFSMPGGGLIDLRSFEAKLDDIRLKLTGTLTPELKRGMRWRGFAELDGDFGNMMKRAGLSSLFANGNMHALFSGQGEIFSDQPWWQALDGRLRMRVDDGRLLKGGTLSKFLAAISLVDLPGLFFGSRDDLTKSGIGYKRLQMEAVMQGKNVKVHKLAMRSSAMDVAGQGVMDIERSYIDLTLVMRPFQNLDALLSKVPILRDMFGGAAHSLIRKVYRMHGTLADAEVEQISPESAGLAAPGFVENLLNLPEKWFGKDKSMLIK